MDVLVAVFGKQTHKPLTPKQQARAGLEGKVSNQPQ